MAAPGACRMLQRLSDAGGVAVGRIEGKGRVLLSRRDLEVGDEILAERPLVRAAWDASAPACAALLEERGAMRYPAFFYWAALCTLTEEDVAGCCAPAWATVSREAQVGPELTRDLCFMKGGASERWRRKCGHRELGTLSCVCGVSLADDFYIGSPGLWLAACARRGAVAHGVTGWWALLRTACAGPQFDVTRERQVIHASGCACPCARCGLGATSAPRGPAARV